MFQFQPFSNLRPTFFQSGNEQYYSTRTRTFYSPVLFLFNHNQKLQVSFTLNFNLLANLPQLTPVFHNYFSCDDPCLQMQFLLDCSTLPLVILARQHFGDVVHRSIFKFTRTWCWSLHNARKRFLNECQCGIVTTQL